MLRLETGCVDDVALLGDELHDRLDGLPGVAEVLQRPRDRLVDDLHRPTADQLLELDQREVGLDARRVAVHHEADGASGREHRGLRVAVSGLLATLDHGVPRLGGSLVDALVHGMQRAQFVVGGLVLAHHPLVRVRVAGVSGIRSDDAGQLG